MTDKQTDVSTVIIINKSQIGPKTLQIKTKHLNNFNKYILGIIVLIISLTSSIFYLRYVNDKKEGFGLYTWVDGRRYEGQWVKGKQHGRGKYFGTDGSIKYGTWEDGKRMEWFARPENETEWLRTVPANFPKSKSYATSDSDLPSPIFANGSTPAK